MKNTRTSWKIPLFKIHQDASDVLAVKKAIERGMFWAIGPHNEEFEQEIAKYIGTKYATVFNSGTSALHAALLAHGIGQGDEVIVPSFTFIATANSPLFVGAKPVFADIEQETLGLDPEDVMDKITKDTKAIIPVHYGGGPCAIAELKDLAKDKGLVLVEDAAEAFGAKVGAKKVGTFGDSAMLSFCSNKVISTGEGGAMVTNSKTVYEKMKLVRSHGRQESKDYFSTSEYMDYVELGYNFRMSNISAALGISQLKKVDKIIAMRRENAAYMTEKLSAIDGVLPPSAPDENFHVYQLYTIRLERADREALSKHLASKGIMTKVFFDPVHKSTFYSKKLELTASLPITASISKHVLSLPMYPSLKKQEIDFIVKEIQYFCEKR